MGRLRIPGDAGAVCRAMTAGDRSGITPELRAAYSRSGLSHLLAVSGLHTGIVFALVNLLLWWLPLLRRGHLLRNLLAAACIWIYVAAAGAATLATAPLVSHTFGIVPLAGVVVNPAAILLGSVVVLAGALWMLLPVGWAAPAFECVLSHTAEGLNALARVTADLPCAAAEYALGGGATAAVYLFFALATVAAWSAEPKKSVHLPA